ncbi:surface-adhesin E family protein [Undibacterium sp. Ji50W]|uniref:surface-adhesin E family protein n=1 Tax=Undibacterium sp. Ji50W TaxID=3413041 RepID=UPI003BF26DBD
MKYICIVFLFICTCVKAADWQLYFEGAGRIGEKYYVDQTSITRLRNGNVKLWERQIANQEGPLPMKDFGGGLLNLYEIDCSERKYRQLAMRPITPTFDNMKAINKMEEYFKEWQEFMPNDLYEARLHVWCGVK